jgi:hypothetical protein
MNVTLFHLLHQSQFKTDVVVVWKVMGKMQDKKHANAYFHCCNALSLDELGRRLVSITEVTIDLV